MKLDDLVLVRGLDDTRRVLRAWNVAPASTLGPWLGLSLAIAVALLGAVYAVALASTPDPTRLSLAGVTRPPEPHDVVEILYRNSLVLALHAMACVAGFIAGSALPQAAARQRGIWRTVHDRAGPLAIAFVIGATAFSLATQAYALGGAASTLSGQLGISEATLLLAILPHALPELMALFLPLAAWTLAARAGRWHELLAATVTTVAIAAPVLVVAAFVEVYASPRVLLAL